MVRAYEEIVDFLASGITSDEMANFQVSEETKTCVEELIQQEKTNGLTPEETAELDHYLQLEHLIRLAKARARQNLGDD